MSEAVANPGSHRHSILKLRHIIDHHTCIASYSYPFLCIPLLYCAIIQLMASDQGDNSWQERISDLSNTASQFLDTQTKVAAKNLTSALRSGQQYFDAASDRTELFVQTGITHFQASEHQALATAKTAIKYTLDHQEQSIAAGIALSLIILPTPRRLLWRATFGRLQSAAAREQSAAQRTDQLIETTKQQTIDAEILLQKLKSTQTEYQAARSALKSTAADVERMTSQVGGWERRGKALLKDLRELPDNKEVLKMRIDAAQAAAATTRQHNALQKVVVSLAKQGL